MLPIVWRGLLLSQSGTSAPALQRAHQRHSRQAVAAWPGKISGEVSQTKTSHRQGGVHVYNAEAQDGDVLPRFVKNELQVLV
jgi:hypothetical protein